MILQDLSVGVGCTHTETSNLVLSLILLTPEVRQIDLLQLRFGLGNLHLCYWFMDSSFQNFGFVGNRSSNAFKNLGNPIQDGDVGANYCTDTILRLDFSGSSFPCTSASKGIKRKWSSLDESTGLPVGSSLCLGLGRSSSSSDSKGSSGTASSAMSSAKETEDASSMDLELDFSLHLGNDKLPSPKKLPGLNVKTVELQPKVDLELSLSTGITESGITSVYPNFTPLGNSIETSSCWKSTISTPPLRTSMDTEMTSFLLNQRKNDSTLPSSILTSPKSSVTCTSGITQQLQQRTNSKTCQIEGCGKGARGASGRCIAHGGGRRCQKPGCHKGAEGRTVYCKAHGGGRRCEYLGCTKSAEGRTDFCIAHGGGRRCSHEGCTRAARGKSGLCIRHGGGKRCQKENCTKSAEGLSGLCISHGGGRRCQHPACTKGAQGSTMYCKAHGGGKRCTYEGCTKGAEGSTSFCKGHGGGKRCSYQGGSACTKSVHGGTLYCVAHGGGKRCAVQDCTRSARGRTDYCVRHGGGKRCKFDGCGKSAQGSTDFCKAHGGGKRCSWGHSGSEFGQNDGPCNSFARGKTGLCASHSALVQDKRIHGGATLGPMIQDPKPKSEKMKEIVNSEMMNIDFMKSTAFDLKRFGEGPSLAPVLIPEGRVHGGSLMAMLAGSSQTRM